MMKVLVLMFGVSLVSSNDVVTWEYLPLPSQDNPWGLESHLGDILPKYTTVFGIPVFGGAEVTDQEFQIGASVLAEWLDNDADGCVDNPEVLEQLTNAKDVGDQYGMGREWMVKPAFIFPSTGIFDTDWDTIYRATILEGFYEAQKVYKSGWFPDCIGAAATGDPYCRDESLEEIWHGITDIGYAGAWPDVFGRDSSLLTQAMDKARGGHFEEVPIEYPASAWYTNPTTDCDYSCQVSEYFYWTISSWVGANVGLYEDIKYQWQPYTRRKMKKTDKKMTAIIRDTSRYRLPRVAPTGKYRGDMAARCQA